MYEYYNQYIASTCAGLAVASTSLHVLWPSTAIPNILSGKSPLPSEISKEEMSWIVMSLFLGTIPGAMISGLMLNKIGRKNSIIILTSLLGLIWLPIAFTNSIWLLCIERCIAGIAISAIIITVMLYNSEISDKNIRGRLGTTLSGWSLFGELLSVSMGPFLTFKVFALVNCALPLISAVLMHFMPESPYYLVEVGKKTEAERHLKRLLAGASFKTDENAVMEDIETTVKTDLTHNSTILGLLTEKLYRKSLIIVIAIKFLQQLSGSSAFGELSGKIVQAHVGKYSREELKIIFATIPLVGVLLSGAFVDKIGRKRLFVISLLGCAIALILEGICCMWLENSQKTITEVSTLATASLIAFSALRALGMGTLPYVLMGEIFATNIRHHGVAFCGTINAVTGFVMIKYFGLVSEVHVLHITFWIFAAICVMGALFVYCLIPETKCKTFAEIQEDLRRRSNCRTI